MEKNIFDLLEAAEGQTLPFADVRALVEAYEAFHPNWHRPSKKMLEVLQRQREIELTGMRSICDKAEAEKRGILASEQRAFDRFKKTAEDLAVLIKPIEDDVRTAGTIPESQRTNPRTDSERSPLLLRSSQRMADVVSDRYGDRGDDYCLGRVLRRMVTGSGELSDCEARALGETSGGAGAFLVPEVLATRVIDRARNRTRVIQAGAITVPMESESLTLPKLLTGATPSWKAEHAEITESSMTFGQLILRAQTLPLLVKMSVELFEDVKPESLSIVDEEIAAAIALELDRAALRGLGTGHEPQGVRNWSGVNVSEVGTGDGALLSGYDELVDAVGDIWAANGTPNGYMMSSRTAKAYAKMKDGSGLPLPKPAVVAALREYITNQIPTNLTVGLSADCSEVYVGDWTQLLIGIRTNFRLEASRVSDDAFKKLQVHVRAYVRADVDLAHADHFAVLTGVRS